MLRFIRSTDGSRTPAEVVAASGIRPGWAWNAITQLQERGYVLLDGGRLTITRAGSQAASRTAA
jgi:DNA-binding IclR family transcriptional regulator